MVEYVKKTIEIDQEAIVKLRKILDLKTDKDVVNMALRIVSDEDDIIEVHKKLAGKVEIEKVFEK